MAAEFKTGDWVQTNSNLVGKIERIVVLTAYVSISQPAGDMVVPHLLSELTKIDPPNTAAIP
jgi:hypothetical protein